MKDLLQASSDSAATAIDQRILEIFRSKEGGIVSGEELSSALSVSRTAIWKHIKALKNMGYQIEALPSQGYRLVAVPDILTPAELAADLNTKRIGTRIIGFRETDSTNEVAYRLADEGAEEGTVVFAECQRRGKGRMGRLWESPAGVNIYSSIILRPPILPMQATQLTFCSAVAVVRTLRFFTTREIAIKWPNDILVNGKKIAGLLNELSAETDKINFVILGIGVNINMTSDQFPSDLRYPATSLLLEDGNTISRVTFARRLLQSLDELYVKFLDLGYKSIRDEWLDCCNVMGRRIRVSHPQSEITGIVTGVDEYGALLLQCPDGRQDKVMAGDITLL